MSNKGHQATASYVNEIQKIVSCVVKEVCFPYKNNEGYLVLGWSGELRLKRKDGTVIFLDITQELTYPDKDDDKVSTVAYIYSISDEERQPLIGFHYHPELTDEPVMYPHIHAYAPEDGRFKHFNLHRRHIPSGRVPREDVIRWLITELEVVPIRENWEEILVETREEFMAGQSWFYGKSEKR